MTTIAFVRSFLRPSSMTSGALLGLLTACDGGITCQDLANCTYPSVDGGSGTTAADSIDASAVSSGPATTISAAAPSTASSASEHGSVSGETTASRDAGVASGDATEFPADAASTAGQPGGDTNSSDASAPSETSASTQTRDPQTSESTALDAETSEPDSNTEQAACDDERYWDAAAGECKPWSTCSEGTYVATEGTAESDRVCSDCPSQTFSTQDNATECAPCNTCGWLGLETACTKSRDASCRDSDVTKQFGSNDWESGNAVAVDAIGDVWVAGFADDLAYNQCALLRRYPADGSQPVDYELDACGQSSANALAVDVFGNVWVGGRVSGVSNQGLVRRYAPDGFEPTILGFGAGSVPSVEDLVADVEGNIWAVGNVWGDLAGPALGGYDAFSRTIPREDDNSATLQFGTEDDDFATSVAVTSKGDVWVVGSTGGDFAGENAGFSDAFVRVYHADGSFPQSHQFGTVADDTANGVVVDAEDNVWVVGTTGGDLSTGHATTTTDVFVRVYRVDGSASTYQSNTPTVHEEGKAIRLFGGRVIVAGTSDGDGLLWTEPNGLTPRTTTFGTESVEYVNDMTVDRWGNVWIAGGTGGALAGNNAGSLDVFVRQISL